MVVVVVGGGLSWLAWMTEVMSMCTYVWWFSVGRTDKWTQLVLWHMYVLWMYLEICTCARVFHLVTCVHVCRGMWAEWIYKVHKGRSVLPSASVKALCVLTLKVTLLVQRLYSFIYLFFLAAFMTLARAHTCAHTCACGQLYKQALTLKDGEKQKPEQKDFNSGNIGTHWLFDSHMFKLPFPQKQEPHLTTAQTHTQAVQPNE